MSLKESLLKAAPSSPARSEDVLGVKWDRCLADTAIKMGGGLAMGMIIDEEDGCD